MSKSVLLLGSPEENFDPGRLKALLAPKFPSVDIRTSPAPDAVGPEADDVEGMVGFGHDFRDSVVARARRLKWIHTLTAGTDAVFALKSLKPDVVVTSSAGLHAPQVSEMAFLHMIALARNYPRMLDNQRAARWERWPQSLLWQKTAVIVGVGGIAAAVARRCKAFDMKVIGVSSTPRAAEHFDTMMARDRLAEAAALADFLVVIVPLTPATRNLIDARVFAAMKPTAILVNVARGGVVDEDALLEALRAKRIAAAGLDVFSREPLPPDSPLWREPRLMITPHVAGISDIYQDQLVPFVEKNLGAYAAGRWGEMINVQRR